MKFISHRGNLDGPKPSLENHPEYISSAIKKGYHVEVDVWVIDNKIILGHDLPEYDVSSKFLLNYKDLIFLHCKNHEAFSHFFNSKFEIFWHELDDFCLTSKGSIWSRPDSCRLPNRIEVNLGQTIKLDLNELSGICSDYIDIIKNRI